MLSFSESAFSKTTFNFGRLKLLRKQNKYIVAI